MSRHRIHRAALVLAGLASVSPAQDRTARVKGQLVDGLGQPVFAALVEHGYPDAGQVVVRSDDEGRFESEVRWSGPSDTAEYMGLARAKGFARANFRGELREGQTLDLGRFALAPGGSVRGRIVFADGSSAEGAELRFVHAEEVERSEDPERSHGPPFPDTVEFATCARDGSFDVIGLPVGRFYADVKHPRSWWRASEIFDIEGGSEIEVPTTSLDPLPPTCRIGGRVLLPDGSPARGARVKTTVERDDFFMSYMQAIEVDVDERGQFDLWLPFPIEGAIGLDVLPPSERFAQARVAAVGGTLDVTVTLEPLREVHVRALDAETGEALDAFGWDLKVDEAEDRTVWSGAPSLPRAGGRATLLIANGSFELVLKSAGYADSEPVRFPAGDVPPIEIELVRLHDISGVVTFEGTPVPDALVGLVRRSASPLRTLMDDAWDGTYYGYKGSTTYTDSSGRFAIPVDFPRSRYFVSAWRDGFGPGYSSEVRVGASDVNVALTVAGTLEGRVLVPADFDPRDVRVRLVRRDPERRGANLGQMFEQRPQADGRYRFDSLGDGEWLFATEISGQLATATDDLELAELPHVVRIESGRTTFFDFDPLATEVCELSGRVAVGELISEGYVKLLSLGDRNFDVDVQGLEPDGRFHLRARAPGRYRIVVRGGPGHHRYKVVTDVVELRLGPNAWERDVDPSRWTGDGIRLDAPPSEDR